MNLPPLATADPVASIANQEANAAAGDTDAGTPAPKEPLLVPASSPSGPEDGSGAGPGGEGDQYAAPAHEEVSPEEAGPRTEEPAALPIATREAAPEQRAFLAPEPPRKAAAGATTTSLSTVPLSATGGSLLLALGAGALIYRRLGR